MSAGQRLEQYEQNTPKGGQNVLRRGHSMKFGGGEGLVRNSSQTSDGKEAKSHGRACYINKLGANTQGKV